MRREFKSILLEAMRKDKNIILLTGDLGYKFLDDIRDELPDQFYNVGSAEFMMVGIGCGLALSGKTPVCHSISPFILWRAAEQLRLYLNHENIPVKLLGSGRGEDYLHDNYSHCASDDKAFLSILPNIKGYWPENMEECRIQFQEYLYNGKPGYFNLKR